MHEAEGKAQGLSLVYKRIDTLKPEVSKLSLSEILDAAKALEFDGLNITHPHKQKVIEHLDWVDGQAQRIGAVNTVVIRDGKLHGYNTDVSGYSRGFTSGLPGVSTNKILQVGAGGAGSAIAFGLAELGVNELLIADVDKSRAQLLAQSVNTGTGNDIARGISVEEISPVIVGIDGVVNATPVGMAEHPGVPIDTQLLKSHQWVSEVIYMPVETALVKESRERGCTVLTGANMAVGQAVDAFELFTGITADPRRMAQTFAELGR